MPDQHRAFFALLPYLFAATLDERGWPMASVLTGATGFVQSPDPATLRIAARPAANDPAAPGFVAGSGDRPDRARLHHPPAQPRQRPPDRGR